MANSPHGLLYSHTVLAHSEREHSRGVGSALPWPHSVYHLVSTLLLTRPPPGHALTASLCPTLVMPHLAQSSWSRSVTSKSNIPSSQLVLTSHALPSSHSVLTWSVTLTCFTLITHAVTTPPAQQSHLTLPSHMVTHCTLLHFCPSRLSHTFRTHETYHSAFLHSGHHSPPPASLCPSPAPHSPHCPHTWSWQSPCAHSVLTWSQHSTCYHICPHLVTTLPHASLVLTWSTLLPSASSVLTTGHAIRLPHSAPQLVTHVPRITLSSHRSWPLPHLYSVLTGPCTHPASLCPHLSPHSSPHSVLYMVTHNPYRRGIGVPSPSLCLTLVTAFTTATLCPHAGNALPHASHFRTWSQQHTPRFTLSSPGNTLLASHRLN
ncbi:hypothetical protein C7M84_025522 [Penaeus vannamei]|uniref:Uncharacterized protein n=1 Tax=Penaeus vannamei TaxID=6689 RepID=A0A3R7MFQ0_PENVA|nr:hypothetical protein C7M84_025522 [Penaeus vannamei]